MMERMINWAIFGAIAVIWTVGFRYVMENYSAGDHVGYIFVTIFTISLVAGKTSGSNGFEHCIDGFKTCVNGLIGWAIATLVYTLIYDMTMGEGFNLMGMVNEVISTEITYLTALMMASAFNGVRE